MFLHEQFDEAIPPDLSREYSIQRIVQETGWTFEYAENLSYGRVAAFWAVRGGQNKVREHRASVNASRSALRRGKR